MMPVGLGLVVGSLVISFLNISLKKDVNQKQTFYTIIESSFGFNQIQVVQKKIDKREGRRNA